MSGQPLDAHERIAHSRDTSALFTWFLLRCLHGVRYGAEISLAAWTLLGCTHLYPARTPEGVDPSPILDVTLAGDVESVETVERFLPSDATHQQNACEVLIWKQPKGRDVDGVYRAINILRCDDEAGAIDEYRSYRRWFVEESGWTLYEERRTDENRYLSGYRAPWMNKNHGIPMGVVNDPGIIIVNQKRNLLLVLSYSSYRDDVDYVRTINEDLAYLGGILRASLATR